VPHIIVNGITVEVVRKDIKNIHLGVYPPNGRVRIAVPLRVTDDAVRMAVVSKIQWITKQQEKFKEQARQTFREYVSGESHYFQGQRFLLEVVHRKTPGVAITGSKTITLYVKAGSTREQREKVMLTWYRQNLLEEIPGLIAKWEPILGVEVAEWHIRRMRTRWGTCNQNAGRIWLNLELIKKPSRCLEYIVVHEMIHLLERGHGERFKALMSKHIPHWKYLRDELNHEPLAHEDWNY